MNETIALPIFAEHLSRIASIDLQSAEKFIRAFFMQLENALAVSDEVTIKGLGTFYRTNNQNEPLGFTPDKELSDALNEPFAIFEPIEIDDDIDTNSLATEIICKEAAQEVAKPQPSPSDIEPETASSHATEELQNAIKDTAPIETATETITAEIEISQGADETDEIADETEDNNIAENDVQPEDAPVYDDTTNHNVPRRNGWVPKLLIFIIGLIIGFVIGFFKDKIVPTASQNESAPVDTATIIIEEPTPQITAIAVDSIETIDSSEPDTIDTEEHPARPVIEPVYDTVTPERFLTTMARKYYGRMEYWVFIYEANSDKLGNPNKIKPGTKVLIPDISSLTENESPEQTLERAKRMGREIYDRFE